MIQLKKYSKYISNLGVYMMASLVPMIVSVAANPLMAKNMSPEDYAVVGYYTAFNMLFLPLINFYLIHYYTKRYFELSEDKRKELRATIQRALIFISPVIALLLIGVLFIYTKIFNSETIMPFSPYAWLAILSIPLTGVLTLRLVDYRMERKSKPFFILSVVNGLFGILLAIILVVILKMGATGKLLAVFIGNLSIYLYCIYSQRDLLKIKFDRLVFIDSVKFCFPLVLAAMLSFFSTGYDKIVLERTGDIIELGYYVVGAQIAGYLTVFSNSINDTFQPDIFQSVVQRNYRKCVKVVAVKLTIVSMIVICFITLAPFVVSILTAGRYVDSTKFAVIISLSTVTSVLYYSMSQITIAIGYTTVTLINKIAGSLFSILTFIFLIDKFGAIGAAWGCVISYLIFFAGNSILLYFMIKQKTKNNG